MMGEGLAGWHGGFMWIFWIVLILIIVFLIKGVASATSADAGADNESPMDILKKRYAKGEINQVEFERKKKELESD